MFIIRLIFYLADGTMDSSFLTGAHIGLGLVACIFLIKMMVQFGLPNHPARFVAYMVGLCTATYFVGLAATDMNYLSPWLWIKWRSLPLITGSLCLLFQTITLAGNFSLIQQKVVSRLPLIAALMCFAFFSEYADIFVTWFLGLGSLFLYFLVKKSRYQKRIYFKMVFLYFIHVGFNYTNFYYGYVVGQIILFGLMFYIFLFEHSFGMAAMMDEFKESLEGDV